MKWIFLAAFVLILLFIPEISSALEAFFSNPLTNATLPNVDPETSQGMGNGQMGFEYMSLPQTKSYGVTLNLTF